MKPYSLSPGAQEDVRSILRYSLRTWGFEQANIYRQALTTCVERLANGDARPKRFTIKQIPCLRLHCRHHYIIAIDTGHELIVIAILHERMDMRVRIGARLGNDRP